MDAHGHSADNRQNDNADTGTVIESAAEFMHLLRKSHDIWHQDSFQRTNWVFRGQRNAKWPLIPSIWRPDNAFVPLIDKISGKMRGVKDDAQPRQDRASAWVYVENLLLHQFRQKAWLDAYPVHQPFDSGAWYSLDELKTSFLIINLFSDNLERKPGLVGVENTFMDPSADPDIALAQHHKIPTRMLDWTEDPLIACFFATDGYDLEKAEDDTVIYALNLKRISPFWNGGSPTHSFEPLFPTVFPDRSNNPYIRAQKGLLTSIHWRFALDYFAEHGQWPSFEKAVVTAIEKIGNFFDLTKDDCCFDQSNRILKKLILKSHAVAALKEILKREGVTKYSIMPSLDNLSEATMDDIRQVQNRANLTSYKCNYKAVTK